MKYILGILAALLLFSCSYDANGINMAMADFMKKNYPNATYKTVISKNQKKFIITDKGNTLTKEHDAYLLTKTLGQFFVSFHNGHVNLENDANLQIIYNSANYKTKSKVYTVPELKEVFSIHFK